MDQNAFGGRTKKWGESLNFEPLLQNHVYATGLKRLGTVSINTECILAVASQMLDPVREQ